MRVPGWRGKQYTKKTYTMGLGPRRMVVGWFEGHPWGVYPIDRLPVKGLGCKTVHMELPARFKSRHCGGERTSKGSKKRVEGENVIKSEIEMANVSAMRNGLCSGRCIKLRGQVVIPSVAT